MWKVNNYGLISEVITSIIKASTVQIRFSPQMIALEYAGTKSM